MRRRERGGRRPAIVLRVAGTWIPSIKRFSCTRWSGWCAGAA